MKEIAKKIVITGGHLTPAQAVIEELKKEGGWEIYYLGRKYSFEGKKISTPESKIMPGLGVKFIPIPAGRLQRRLTPYTFLSLIRVPFAFHYALWLLLKIRPNVILSFGGYVSTPVVMAGWVLRTPVLTHEQTVVSGLANRINAQFSQKILVSFPESLKHFPETKTVLTGNPLRQEIFNYQQPTINNKQSLISSEIQLSNGALPLIYITGGNQGAQVINQAVFEILPDLLQKYRIIHQCGSLDHENLKSQISRLLSPGGKVTGGQANLKSNLKRRYCLTDYVGPKDIGWVLNKADLVISRAGANTICELQALGKPAVLIPIPWSARNEQDKNAQMLVETGSAVVLPQSRLSGKMLQKTIEKMMANLDEFEAKAKEAKEKERFDAASLIVDQIKCVL